MSRSASNPVVVVGVDGSASSDVACKWAARYAQATNGTLRVVTAWSWPRMYGMSMMVDALHPEADAKHVVDSAVAGLPISPDQLETRVVEGRAAEALIAECVGADLLVVGRHGHVVDRVLLGSVSNDCVHNSKVPVVVVPS